MQEPDQMRSICPKSMNTYVTDWKMSPGVLSGGFLFLTGMTGASFVTPDTIVELRIIAKAPKNTL